MTGFVAVECPRCKARYRIPGRWLTMRHYCNVCKALGYPQAGYPVLLVPLADVASVEAKREAE